MTIRTEQRIAELKSIGFDEDPEGDYVNYIGYWIPLNFIKNSNNEDWALKLETLRALKNIFG